MENGEKKKKKKCCVSQEQERRKVQSKKGKEEAKMNTLEVGEKQLERNEEDTLDQRRRKRASERASPKRISLFGLVSFRDVCLCMLN